MRIIVKAKASAKEEKIQLLSQPALHFPGTKQEMDIYKVSIKEPPVGGQANDAITKVLAKHFNISISNIKLISGATSKQKIFEIDL